MDPPGDPAEFVGKGRRMIAIERLEKLIPVGNIEAEEALQLGEVDRAQVHGPCLSFRQAVAAVHAASEIYAVSQAEGVANFVACHFTAPLEELGALPGGNVAHVARKGENSRATLGRRHAKDEIPALAGIEIRRGGREERYGVPRLHRLEGAEDAACMILLHPPAKPWRILSDSLLGVVLKSPRAAHELPGLEHVL